MIVSGPGGGYAPLAQIPRCEPPLISIFGGMEPPALTCTAAWPRPGAAPMSTFVNLYPGELDAVTTMPYCTVSRQPYRRCVHRPLPRTKSPMRRYTWLARWFRRLRRESKTERLQAWSSPSSSSAERIRDCIHLAGVRSLRRGETQGSDLAKSLLLSRKGYPLMRPMPVERSSPVMACIALFRSKRQSAGSRRRCH